MRRIARSHRDRHRFSGDVVMANADAAQEPLMTLLQVCEVFQITPAAVHKARNRGGHPLFSKGFCPLGTRAGLRWRAEDVRDFIETQYTSAVSA